MSKPEDVSQWAWDFAFDYSMAIAANPSCAQEAIALALSQAYSRGLEDAAVELKSREKAHGQYANSIAAIRALGSK